MRIWHIDRQPLWSGQVARLLKVCRGLRERGHEVGVVAHVGAQLGERARAEEIDVVEVPMHGWRLYPSAARLGRLLHGRGIDVLHAHGSRDHLAALVAHRIARIPCLVRTKHNHQHLHSGVFSRIPYRLCDRVVAVSSYVRDVLVEDGLDPARVTTIPTAIRLDRFAPRPSDPDLRRELGIRPDDLVVGHVSSLHVRKGIEELLRAVAELAEGPLGPRLRCLLVGRAHALWEPLVEELGLEERVIFTGFVEDPAPLMAELDVFVLPSRDEALGTSVLEAMAVERSVVATRVGGLVEAVREKAGILVPPRDPGALAGAVEELLKDPGRRARMGRHGRERVKERYGVERMVDRTVALYRGLGRGQSAPSGRRQNRSRAR